MDEKLKKLRAENKKLKEENKVLKNTKLYKKCLAAMKNLEKGKFYTREELDI